MAHPLLTVHLLGKPELAFDGKPWRWGAPPRAWTLLACLVLRDALLPRAALAATLWPECSDDEARANLRRHLHHLQRALPSANAKRPWFIADARNVGWNHASNASIDVREFERCIQSDRLQDALKLYRGDLLEDAFADCLVPERERLRGVYLTVLWTLLQRARAARDFAKACAFGERMLATDEWREDAVRALMSIHFESGDRAGALATFERFAERLRSEMHVEPMDETLALHDAIRNELPLSPAPLTSHEERQVRWSAPFVGRDAELDALRTRWQRAARGDGGTVVVAGEAGIGKTRLVRELMVACEAEGARVLWGATSSPAEETPFQPIAAALRRAASTLSSALAPPRRAALSSIIAELRDETYAATVLNDERERSRLFEAITDATIALSERRPLVLIFEDLQWAGATTLDAIEHLGARMAGRRAMVIVTHRSDALTPEHPLHQLRRRLSGLQIVALGRLRAQDVVTIVTQFAEANEAPGDLAERAYRLSEGNPLIAIESLRTFAETRELPTHIATGIATNALIGDRFDRLPRPAQRVAEVASVIGTAFRADLICDVTGWEERDVLDVLGNMVDRHLVREAMEDQLAFEFSHHLVHDAVYGRLNSDVRRRRHRRVATLLEARGDAAPAVIAGHWERADDPARTHEAYVKAAAAALRVYANADASEFAKRALRFAEDDRGRFAALEIATDAAYRGGDTPLLADCVQTMEQAAQSLGDRERYVAARMRERLERRRGDHAGAAAALQALDELAGRSDDQALRFEVLCIRGNQSIDRGRHRDSITLFREALQVARHADPPLDALKTVNDLVRMLVIVGRVDEAERELKAAFVPNLPDENGELTRAALHVARARNDWSLRRDLGFVMIENGRRCGDSDVEAEAHLHVANAALELERFDEARRHFELAASLYERMRRNIARTWILTGLGGMAQELGNFDEAARCFRESGAVARNHGSQGRIIYALLNEAGIALLLEDYSACTRLVHEALDNPSMPELAEEQARANAFLGVAVAHTDAKRGVELVRSAVEAHRSVGIPAQRWWLLSRLIDVGLIAGDAKTVSAAAEELRKVIETQVDRALEPADALHALARAAQFAGNLSEAEGLFERAWRAFARRRDRIGDPGAKAQFERAYAHNRALVERYGKRPLTTGPR